MRWTAAERNAVLEMHRSGLGYSRIAELTDIPRATVWTMINRYERSGPRQPSAIRRGKHPVSREPAVVTPAVDPPVVIGPAPSRVIPGSSLASTADMAALWVRVTADKLVTDKVRAEDRKALARLENAWEGFRRIRGE